MLISYKRSRLFRCVICLLLFSITSFILSMEAYYQYGQCTVSEKYLNKNIEITHQVIDMLNNLSIPYWIDCQSLLNVLRNETYNVWDHDIDLSIEWSVELNNIDLFIKKIELYGFKVEYDSRRTLLSLRFPEDPSPRQSHVDIWLWTRKYFYNDETNEQYLVLESPDRLYKYRDRLISHIYPLKSTKWLNRNVTIPFDSNTISYKEYGESYLTATVFRVNCIHNFFNVRWL